MLKDDNQFSDIEEVYASIDETINFKEPHIYKIINKMQYPLYDKQFIMYDEVITKLNILKSNIREVILNSFKLKDEKINEGNQIFKKLEELLIQHGDNKFQIITTNYDLVIYRCSDSQNREIIDGFSKSQNSLQAVWSNKWNATTDNPIYLNKLHGSINWQMQDDEGKKIIQIGVAGHRPVDFDVMINPTLGKKDYKKTPFSELIERFKNTLDDIDMLIVIGFSFRDDELNKIIRDKLEDKRLVIISISPDSHDHIKRLTPHPIILDLSTLQILLDSLTTRNVHHSLRKYAHRIYSYKCEFGLSTIGEIQTVLETVIIYETLFLHNGVDPIK